MKLIIFTDGASRGNPGQASYGFTISDEEGKLLYEEGGYIGIATNNVAEYTAVLSALKYVQEKYGNLAPLDIRFFMDSNLVAQQLSGRFKIKNQGLKVIIDQIKVVEMMLGLISYSHVPRERNKIADRLANQALDSRL